ncbi:FG-GAP repeat domain-containing protein [Myxococcus xanthus]|uniref:FG-GAP repeat domain-containing protein n=1 Tax=Myxococcus xanthus TaxID=34 RepID=UPI001375FE28|nr:VCBS repeat-containing protein [Myxococcus xanthus]
MKKNMHLRSMALSMIVGGVLATLVSMPAVARGEVQLPPISVALEECSSCPKSTTGTIAINFLWTATTGTSSIEGAAPSNAVVESIYLAGPPLGQNILISRIDLVHLGWVNAIFRSYANGHVWYPMSTLPVMAPWAGRLVNGGEWEAVPTVVAMNANSQLSIRLIIKWYVPGSGGGGPGPGPVTTGSGGTKYFADFNGDGYSDLFRQNPQTGEVETRFGRTGMGELYFSAPTRHLWLPGRKFVPGDFNGDGYSDLLLFDVSSGAMEIRYGQANLYPFLFSLSSQRVLGGDLDFIPGDFNGDGMTDVLLYEAATGFVSMMFGDVGMDGLHSTPATIEAWTLGLTLVPGDFNGDGYSDLFIYYPWGNVEIRYGRSSFGSLHLSAASQEVWSPGLKFVPGDFNGDGLTDLFLYHTTTGNGEIRFGATGLGSLTFSLNATTSGAVGFDFVVGDFNGDGRSDLFVYRLSDGYTAWHAGVPGVEFPSFVSGSNQYWGAGVTLAPGDYNGDGYTDLFLLHSTGAVEIRYGHGGGPTLLVAPSTYVTWLPGLNLVSGYIYRR